MVLAKAKNKPRVLTKEAITAAFDLMREAVRNAPHHVPTLNETNAEYEPIFAQMEKEFEEEAKFVKEHGFYPWAWKGRGHKASKNPVEAPEMKPEGGKDERSGKKRPTPAEKPDRRS